MSHSQQIPYQNIPNGISTSKYVEKLEDFLETHLVSFSPTKIEIGDSEEDITEKVYHHLQNKSKDLPFYFQTEARQKTVSGKGHKKRVDLGVHIYVEDNDSELIYCIEGKRLPTDKPNGEREKEYVFGKGGGIERFKTNQHGKNRKGELLERNGMIGYIQQNDFDYWHSSINNWIENNSDWHSEEALKKSESTSGGKYTSEHIRTTKDKVFLTHFWLNLC